MEKIETASIILITIGIIILLHLYLCWHRIADLNDIFHHEFFEAIFLTAGITLLISSRYKEARANPKLTPAREVLEMATIEGAKTLSWQREIGSIEARKKADLIIVNLCKPHLYPMYNEKSHLVYAAKAEDVDTVIINGKIVMENRKMTTIKADEAMKTAEKAKIGLMERVEHKVK